MVFTMHIKDVNMTNISPKTGTLTVPGRIIFRTWRETWKARVGKGDGPLHPGCVSGEGIGLEIGNLPAEDGGTSSSEIAHCPDHYH